MKRLGQILCVIQLSLSMTIMASASDYEQISLSEEANLNIQSMQPESTNAQEQLEQTPLEELPNSCAFHWGKSLNYCSLCPTSFCDKRGNDNMGASICSIMTSAFCCAGGSIATGLIGCITKGSLVTIYPAFATLPGIYQCAGFSTCGFAACLEKKQFGNDFGNGFKRGYSDTQCGEQFRDGMCLCCHAFCSGCDSCCNSWWMCCLSDMTSAISSCCSSSYTFCQDSTDCCFGPSISENTEEKNR